jgi:hypothetical protein
MMNIECPILNVEGKKMFHQYSLIKSDITGFYFVIQHLIFNIFLWYDRNHKHLLLHVGILHKIFNHAGI